MLMGMATLLDSPKSEATDSEPDDEPAVCIEQCTDATPVALKSPEASILHAQQQQGPMLSQEFLLKVAVKQGHRLPEGPEQQKKFLAKLTHLHLNGMHLQQLSSIKLCPKLQVLYLFDNQLTSISSIAGNRLITHLYLQNNQLQSLDGLQELPLLHKLYLQNNQLSVISQLAAATRLEELHVSNQQLKSLNGASNALHQPGSDPQQQQQQQQPALQQSSQHIQGTAPAAAAAAAVNGGNKVQPTSSTLETGGLAFETASLQALSESLKVLAAAQCGIADPRPLSMLHNLRTLDLSYNNISRIEALQPLLQGLRQLHSLDLRGNGCVQQAKYRDYVILLASDSLAVLDGEVIPGSHRAYLLGLHLSKLKAQATSQHQQHVQQQHGQQSQRQRHAAEGTTTEERGAAAAAARFRSIKGSVPSLLEASASAAAFADGVGSLGLCTTAVKLHPCKAPAARPPAVAGFNVNAIRIGAALGSAASHWLEQGHPETVQDLLDVH